MQVGNVHMRTIECEAKGAVRIIDQTRLPYELVTIELTSLADVARAIRTMQVRGAPLIGAAAAYGLCLALSENAGDDTLARACDELVDTRPTAVNLRWAVDRLRQKLSSVAADNRVEAAYALAQQLCDEDVAQNQAIAEHGLPLLEMAWRDKGALAPLNVLTHCNAGWLATVDWGTALGPVYLAHARGIPVHVWVDETRPRNQGASLTAWELEQARVPYTLIVDNAGGHLMQHGKVDLCLVGSDRTTRNGDVANKIGTYLKALAASDNQVPFYVAVPSSSIDWSIDDGVRDIPIEERNANEVLQVAGCLPSGEHATVRIAPSASPAANYAFDVTPARLVTALITERGVCTASPAGLAALFGDCESQSVES